MKEIRCHYHTNCNVENLYVQKSYYSFRYFDRFDVNRMYKSYNSIILHTSKVLSIVHMSMWNIMNTIYYASVLLLTTANIHSSGTIVWRAWCKKYFKIYTDSFMGKYIFEM